MVSWIFVMMRQAEPLLKWMEMFFSYIFVSLSWIRLGFLFRYSPNQCTCANQRQHTAGTRRTKRSTLCLREET